MRVKGMWLFTLLSAGILVLASEKVFPALRDDSEPELLQRMVTAGDLGRKTGQGFYPYP